MKIFSWVWDFYKKNKKDFLVAVLIASNIYLIYQNNLKDNQIKDYQSEIKKNTKFLTDWIDRHDKQK